MSSGNVVSQWCEQFLRYAGAAIPPGRTGVAEAGMGMVTAHPGRMRGGFRAVAARFGPDPGGPAGPAGIFAGCGPARPCRKAGPRPVAGRI